MKNMKKILSALAISSAVAFSSMAVSQESISDPEMKKVIEMIKLEIAQHTGMQAYYDAESQIVTLSGFAEDRAYVGNLVTKLESFDHVKEVRNSISFSDNK